MQAPTENGLRCVVLTATVNVQPDMCMTVRSGSQERLDDYRRAFAMWLDHPSVFRIVLVENSGFDLSVFSKMAERHPDKRCEFLSFVCPRFDGSRGKGYGESFCIEKVVQDSKLVRQSSHFVKVSGRYFLRNIDDLFAYLFAHPHLDVVCSFKRNLAWVDSRAYACTIGFMEQYFLPIRDQIDDSMGINFEHVLARAAHMLMAHGGSWSMMPSFPEIEGIHATDNRSFHVNPMELRIRRLAHQVKLRLLGANSLDKNYRTIGKPV